MSVHGHIGIFALAQIAERGLISQLSASAVSILSCLFRCQQFVDSASCQIIILLCLGEIVLHQVNSAPGCTFGRGVLDQVLPTLL